MFVIVTSLVHMISCKVVIAVKKIMFELSSIFRRTWNMFKISFLSQIIEQKLCYTMDGIQHIETHHGVATLNNAWNSPYWDPPWGCHTHHEVAIFFQLNRYRRAFHSSLWTSSKTFSKSSMIIENYKLVFPWLCVFIMSYMRFTRFLHSLVAWMSRNSLLKTGPTSKI